VAASSNASPRRRLRFRRRARTFSVSSPRNKPRERELNVC
jgi:hypothetical protein